MEKRRRKQSWLNGRRAVPRATPTRSLTNTRSVKMRASAIEMKVGDSN